MRIDPERLSADLFRRDAQDRWVLYPFETGSQVDLASLDLKMPIESLYEDVRFNEAQPHAPAIRKAPDGAGCRH